MNRYACRMMGSVRSIPHVCGDEPRRTNYTEIEVVVYPTYVGMNRSMHEKSEQAPCMPHVCGDEPILELTFRLDPVYAPRVWG